MRARGGGRRRGWGRRRRRRGRRRGRRDIDAHARVIPDPHLLAPEVLVRVAVRDRGDVDRGPRVVQAIADEEPIARLIGQPDRGFRQVRHLADQRRLARRERRRHQRRRRRQRVALALFAVQFRREAQARPRRERGAHAPADAVGHVHRDRIVRIPAPDLPGRPRQFELLVDLLADDEIQHPIHLARAGTRLRVAGRQLDDAAHRDGDRLLPPLGHDVELRAQQKVAEAVAAPALPDQGVVVDQPAMRRIGQTKERVAVVIDPRINAERPEDLDPIPDAAGAGNREVTDVGQALRVIPVRPIAAARIFLVRQDLGCRHEPQAGVAEKGRRRGSRVDGPISRR